MADTHVDTTEAGRSLDSDRRFPPPVPARWLTRSRDVRWARRVLRADAVLCAVSGVLLVAAAGALSRLVEDEPVRVVRGVGVFLVVLAASLATLSLVRPARMPRVVAAVGVLNGAWVAATIAVVAAGRLDPLGVTLALATALVVAAVAWEEIATANHLRRGLPPLSEPTGAR